MNYVKNTYILIEHTHIDDLSGENDNNFTVWPMGKLSGKYLSPQSPKGVCK